MCSGIGCLFALVASLCDDLVTAKHDCPDGHLAGIGGLSGKRQRDVHRVTLKRSDHGGGGGIRTHGGLHLTRFPSVPIRPLSHPSKDDADAYQFRVEAIGEGRLTSWR